VSAASQGSTAPYLSEEVAKRKSVLETNKLKEVKSKKKREQLLRCYYFKCFKCSKKEIIIDYNSGETNPSFVAKNPCGITGNVTIQYKTVA
jgi:hypothetical protein